MIDCPCKKFETKVDTKEIIRKNIKKLFSADNNPEDIKKGLNEALEILNHPRKEKK